MATCRDVVTRALRLSGVIGLTEDPPGEEAVFGMDALSSLFLQWAASGMFGRLEDVYVSAAYTAHEWERVHTTGSPTITIPDTFDFDGEEGDARPPYDLSLIEVQDGSDRNVWLYDRSDWVDLNALDLNAECPLSTRGVNGLAACLATSANGPFMAEVPPLVMREALKFLQTITFKAGSTRKPRVSEYY